MHLVDHGQVRRARSTRRWRDLSSKEAATRAASPVRFHRIEQSHDHHHVHRIDHHVADELMVNAAVHQNDKKPFLLKAMATILTLIIKMTLLKSGRLQIFCISVLTIRVFHFYTFFELSLVLLTTQAHGL